MTPAIVVVTGAAVVVGDVVGMRVGPVPVVVVVVVVGMVEGGAGAVPILHLIKIHFYEIRF